MKLKIQLNKIKIEGVKIIKNPLHAQIILLLK
jgi:hypothetical protein